MGEKTYKMLRKQLRNVVQQLLPSTLENEMYSAVEKRVNNRIDARCDAIASHVKSTLEAIDSRSKDIQSFVVRNNASGGTAPVPVPRASSETPISQSNATESPSE